MKPLLILMALRAGWILSIPLLMLMLPQALYVKRTTKRLMEATGPRYGKTLGKGPGIRLLHVGESTVAGVGVSDMQQGFTANLASSMNQSSQQQIHWQVLGVNGIKIGELLNQLQQETLNECDIALVTMGVNDTTKLTSLNKWREQIRLTINQLLTLTQGPIIFTQVPAMAQFPALPAPLKYLLGLRAKLLEFTQVPAMAQFPALPAPLKYLLGLRAKLLDVELQRVCKNHNRAHYVSSKPSIEPHLMAEDGYHPSEQGYQEWAKSIGPSILQHYSQHKP